MYIDELKSIDIKLELIIKDLDIQFSAMTIDSATFHKNMLEVSSKHPESQTLIQFIVFVNDRLETNQTIYRGILLDSLKNLIVQKQMLIKRLIVEAEQREAKASVTERVGKFFKDNKTILIVISATVVITSLVVSLLLVPSETIEALKLIASMSPKSSK
jgi:arsenate reductase-like glutaredoxin family protein